MQTNNLSVFNEGGSYTKYVKITPTYLTFQEAYPGKKYNKILEVQNCYHKPIEVVFGKPSSMYVTLKSDKNNYQLCTGLKCFCKLIYEHPHIVEVSKLILPIYVNDFTIDYKITVISSKPIIKCEPYDVDFGKMNMHQVNKRRTVDLTNSGTQNTQFSIDLGRNDLNIVVFPQKGIIPAKGKVLLHVDILGCRKGSFDEEVWIKCDVPQRLRLFGEFIIPKLITNNPLFNRFFTLIDFSNVYFGQEVNNYISIENYSSEQTMYCVESVEPLGFFMDIRKTDKNFRCFNIHPYQGRIEAKKKTTIEFKFKPIRKQLGVRSEYFAGVVKIRKLDYTDIIYDFANEDTDDENDKKTVNFCKIESSSSLRFGYSQGELSLKSPIELEQDSEPEINYLKIFLHGEAEKAGITIEPFDKSVIKTTIGETVKKNVIIKNQSNKLPITVETVRMSGIKSTPHKFVLEPEAYTDVYIEVTPKQMKFNGNLSFNLYHENTLVGNCTYPINYEAKLSDKSIQKPIFNMGITPKIAGEVGVNCEDVRYNTKYALPRCAMACLGERKRILHGNEIIAFPNDRLKTMQTSKVPVDKCTTIFANIPRFPCGVYDENLHNSNIFKKKNNNYYDSYLRRSVLKRKDRSKPSKKSNLNDMKVLKRPYTHKVKEPKVLNCTSFVLCPNELANITISPKKMVIKNVAPNTDVRAVFTVCNENLFNIIGKLQSDDSQITVESLGSTCIVANTSKEMGMIYRSSRIGKKVITVECVLNDAHIFKIELIIVVVPKEVYLNKDEIVINPFDGHSNYLELKNILNSPVEFKWIIEDPIFEIFPPEGCIPSGHTLLCYIEYLKAPRVSDSTYVTLYSEGGAEKLIKITYQCKSICVGVDIKSIDFKGVPLCKLQTKYFTIRNFSAVSATFTVNTPQPIHGINVTPEEGVIPKKGDQYFKVTGYFEVPIKFNCIISVHVERHGDIDIDVRGDSLLPSISMSPNYINLRKIMPYSVDVTTFTIKNLTEGEVSLEFVFNDYLRNYFISSSMNEKDKLIKIVLERLEMRTLYLHFHPTEVTVFAFFLPIIANEIFGPAVLNEPKSVLYETYTKKPFRMYRQLNNVSLITASKAFDLIKVTSVVTQPFLKFSNFCINMIYHHDTNYKSKNVTTFEVSNITKDKEMQFCIRTDELNHPFTFVRSEGKFVDCYNKSIHCTLLPGEFIIFNVRFQPKEKEFGTFTADLPVYLKDFYECVAFNTIKIKGTYFKATITSNFKQDVIYFQPTILRQSSEIIIKLQVNYHFDKCCITGLPLQDVQFHFPEGRRLDWGKKTVTVILTYCQSKASQIQQPVNFECSCTKTKYSLTARGCIENCIPTSYANFFRINNNITSTHSSVQLEDSNCSFGQINESTVDSSLVCAYLNDTSFPLFPLDNDCSEYANFMRRIHQTSENWLNTQALYNSKYRTIPEGISATPIEFIVSTDGKKSADDSNPLLVQILINFGGRDARRYICSTRPSNLDEIKHVAFLTHTYSLCLEYIHAHGGLLPHVSVEYLLSYRQFMVYKKYNEESLEFSEDECEEYFHRRSKQSYIDVVLQMYKVFILNRIKFLHTKSQLSFRGRSRKMESQQLVRYSQSEKYLLKWAEKNYEAHKFFWGYNKVKPSQVASKHFENFETDFSDGLVIAAIFITYCPFLKDDLKDMYSQPENFTQLYHNANKVCNVWYTLKLSLGITPSKIIETNLLEMLIIINYLHDVVQNYLPNETVMMNANLTGTTERSIVVENHEDRTLWYYVMFFGKDAERFTSESQMILVAPRSNHLLRITYFAKTFDRCNATLVLCGEYAGHKYSKTLSTNLVGITVAAKSPEITSVTSKIYEISRNKLNLGKKLPGVYDLYLAVVVNDSYELNRYDKDIELDVPPFQYYRDAKLIINSEGDVVNDALITSNPTTLASNTNVFARNSENGDFHIVVTANGLLSKKDVEYLVHQLPNNFENFACTCNKKSAKFSTTCLRTQQIKIPKRNNILFRGFVNYLFEVLHPIDKIFCKRIKDKPVFSRIIKYFVDQRHKKSSRRRAYDICFADVIKYAVKVADKSLETIDYFDISNVYEIDFEPLPVHIEPNANFGKNFKITLKSIGLHIDETRIYSIKFIA